MIRRDWLRKSAALAAGATAAPLLHRLGVAAEPAQPKPLPPEALGYDIEIPPQPVLRFEGGERTPTPPELLDILAIERLQMAYGQLHEHGTADEIAAMFHPAAELYALYLSGKGFRGRKQIRDWYAWWLELYPTTGEYYRHRPLNQVIDLHGDRAVSSSVLVAEGTPRANEAWSIFVGRYVHELIRHDGGWLFWRSWIILHARTEISPRTRNPRAYWS